MKHNVPFNGKFLKLLRQLKALDCFKNPPVSVATLAVGLLERLWHIGISDRPRGDIGYLDNEIIAEMIGWEQDADLLIDILVATQWLDKCSEHRLIIHDWHEHAPNHIKKNIQRQGGFIRNPSSAEDKSHESSPPMRGENKKVSLVEPFCPNTKPNETKPNETERDVTKNVIARSRDEISWTRADGFKNISTELRQRWEKAYPAVDIDMQLSQMHEWLLSNPEKSRKSRWSRFINNWLKRHQDRGGDAKSVSRVSSSRADADKAFLESLGGDE